MKTKFSPLSVTVLIVVILAGTSCKKETEFNNNSSDFNSRVLTLPKESLSADETASLAWMREVEKLARDVYTYFQQRWASIFSII